MSRLAGPTHAAGVAFGLLTAFYALLSSQDFAYEQFLKPKLFPPLALFAEWHAWLNLGVWAASFAARRSLLRAPEARAFRWLLAGWCLLGIVLLGLPPLAELGPGPGALLVAGLALLAVFGIVWAEWCSTPRPALPESGQRADPITRDFVACLAAGAVSSLIHSAVAGVLGAGAGEAATLAGAVGWLQALVLHELLFVAVFCGLTVLRGLGAFVVAAPRRAEATLAAAALAGLMVLVMHAIVLPGLSIQDPAGRALGTGFGLALGLAIAARGLARADRGADAVARVLQPLVPRAAGRSAPAALVWLLAIGALALAFGFASAQADWNRIVSRIGVVTTWLLVFAACLHSVRCRIHQEPIRLYAVGCALLAAHVALGSPLAAGPLVRGRVAGAEAREPGMNPASRFLDDLLRPPARVDGTLFALLQQHTNISRKRLIEPVEMSLAELEGPPSEYRPHIFVIVVDSLRRDYLSTYNPKVDFTPEIARFAAESQVFRNAFTRYGATGLSVPAMWVGAPQIHRQYVTPFAPMNTLAKLLEHERYAQWIGMDNILDAILPPSAARAPLDADVRVKDYRLCRTLEELRGRLGRLPASAPPVFAYTLPQDIHVSVLTREGGRSIDDADYAGFSAPVASRLRRLDACFGDFVGDLRRRGLYEDSLIVLTSDHGDSLGEEGRVGHAYGLHPEVIRIPLIVHLPARLREAFEADVEAPAYNSDLAPTLYRLLGHELEPSSPLFGRPLFHAPGEAPAPRREGVMVASSYGAVYGALLDSARHLYIVDTINAREHAYRLDEEPLGERIEVDPTLRQRGSAAIRETIEAVAELYGYEP